MGAPSATRTRDLPLRRSFRVLRSTVAMLLRRGSLVVLVLLDARSSRLVLARGWHGPRSIWRESEDGTIWAGSVDFHGEDNPHATGGSSDVCQVVSAEPENHDLVGISRVERLAQLAHCQHPGFTLVHHARSLSLLPGPSANSLTRRTGFAKWRRSRSRRDAVGALDRFRGAPCSHSRVACSWATWVLLTRMVVLASALAATAAARAAQRPAIRGK